MSKSSERVQKVAVVALKDKQVCLVTTRRGRRWVTPKGTLKRGTPARETALQEAWEEAGVVGTLRPNPVFSCLSEKSGRLLHFTVFVMDVLKSAKEWPEQHQRKRGWFTSEEALVQVHCEGLRQAILQAIEPVDEEDWPLLKRIAADLRRYLQTRSNWRISEWSMRWQRPTKQSGFALTLNVAGDWAAEQRGQIAPAASPPEAAIKQPDKAESRPNGAHSNEKAA